MTLSSLSLRNPSSTREAPTSRHQLTFNIERLDAWAPGVSTEGEWRAWRDGELAIAGEGEPAVRQMPAMIRRHTGRVGKLACEIAYDVTGNTKGMPIVFSSRYGDVSRSVELLTSLASGADLSPTCFGLSVHNAIVGLLAMARQDNANCVALAGGDESAECGMLEACSLIADGAERVLLIIVDCPLPPIYSMFTDVHPVAFAWGGVVVPAPSPAFSLEWDVAHEAVAPDRQLPGGLTVLRFLQGDENELVRVTPNRRWRWRREA